MSENSNNANPHESFKQLVDYIKLIVTLTVSWLGIISAMFFFFLWQDRQAAKDAISKIEEEAKISIKKVETKTLTKLDSINDAIDKEVREKVNRYFEKEDIEALVEAKFKKLVIPKVNSLVKKRGDEILASTNARMDRRDQINFHLSMLRSNRSNGLKNLYSTLKEPTTNKEDKEYILSETNKIINDLFESRLAIRNSSSYDDTIDKNRVRNSFNTIHDNYVFFWEGSYGSLGLSVLFEIHDLLNVFFETNFSILEPDELLEKCEEYLNQQEDSQ